MYDFCIANYLYFQFKLDRFSQNLSFGTVIYYELVIIIDYIQLVPQYQVSDLANIVCRGQQFLCAVVYSWYTAIQICWPQARFCSQIMKALTKYSAFITFRKDFRITPSSILPEALVPFCNNYQLIRTPLILKTTQ